VDEIYTGVTEHYNLRDNGSSREKERPVIVVSSLVRNIIPSIIGAQKQGDTPAGDGLSLGHAVGSYAKGELLQRRGTIMRVR